MSKQTAVRVLSKSFGEARDMTRRALFPVSWRIWLAIGIIALLDGIGQGSLGFSYGLRSDAREFVRVWLPFFTEDADIAQMLLEQTGLLLVVGLPGVLLIFLGSILLLWLGSHGQLMFVRAVSRNSYAVRENWRETAEGAQSLFMFRLALASFAFVLLVVIVLASSLFVRGDAASSSFAPVDAFVPVVYLGFIGTAAAVIVNAILRNLVAPIMYQLNLTCLDACKVVWQLIRRAPLPMLGFFLIHTIWIGLTWGAWLVAGCVTCGLGLIPGIHHAIVAPLYVFDRLFSMFLLEKFWPNERFVESIDGGELSATRQPDGGGPFPGP